MPCVKTILLKDILYYFVIVSNTGAPPWVPFGDKIQTGDQGKPFKSLDKGKDGETENSEFNQQRKEAIAEASSGAVRKTFGGRVKQNVQTSIQQNYRGNPFIEQIICLKFMFFFKHKNFVIG